MDYADWEPLYHAICRDFGYDRQADVDARDRLAAITDPFDLDRLTVLEGQTVCIAGAGPSLENELESCRVADAVIATSGAATILGNSGIEVVVQVTDLDTAPERVVERTEAGGTVAIHAHGDNREAIESVVPRCAQGAVLPTTQVRPSGHVHNFGGFTDGDRGAFLADAVGAAALTFAGWDFDDPTVDPQKARKLEWAAYLLWVLERRRDDTFPVLDDRRANIEAPEAPR